MTYSRMVRWIIGTCLLAIPLAAQPQIGGGTCSSASLNGSYAFSLTGRQVTGAGTFTNIFQAEGTAHFDGLSVATITLTADTPQSVGAPLTWTGTYSVQANCAGTATITTGGSATLYIAIYNQGSNFLVTGADATYFYTGSGNTQPSACSTSLLSGSYVYSGTGYGFSGTSLTGIANGTGLLQFDGQGKVTANIGISGSVSTALAATGSYSVSSNCTGMATLSDSTGNAYTMGLSISSGNTTASTDLMAMLGQASKFTMDGSAHAVTAATCSPASLTGTYSLTLSGRDVSSAGSLAGSFQGNGTATFDGMGNVVLAGTSNTNQVSGKTFSYTGTYSLPASCSGTMTLTTTGAAAMNLVVWSSAKQFNITGADSTYVYSGSGGPRPAGCANATLSGEYTYDASGFTLSGTSQTGVGDEVGVLNFDGQGNVTGNYTVTSSGTVATTYTSSGTYSVTPNCLGTAALMDSVGNVNALNFGILNTYGQGVDVIEANPRFVRSGSAHAAFLNPTQSIGNVASYAVNYTPPGSVFVLFGENLAAKPVSATTVPLPATLGSTGVTVNGEPAPLFYVDSGQIDAQMPWDIPGGTVASVIVKNGNVTSNAAAVFVPATGTPGISFYSTNRAVVVNQDGTLNSSTAGASVGDEVVAYFTGGGPVQAAGKLTTGAAAPSGLSEITGASTVTVGTATAVVKYIGLTPGSVGLYQVNFIVPQLSKGTYGVVIDIANQDSNNPVMTITN
jgi:uncharacterized protein (TIGR03437 family)